MLRGAAVGGGLLRLEPVEQRPGPGLVWGGAVRVHPGGADPAGVLQEERQQTEGGGRKYYLGLPITASALAFPLFYLLGLLLPGGPYILAAGMLLLAALYVTPLHIPKPGLAAICLLSAVGALELAGLILAALGRL